MKKVFFIVSMSSLFIFAGCGTTAVPAKITPTTTWTTQTTPVWYTMQDVQKHNTANDCRIVIEGKIYNMSNFSSLHSGWPDPIVSVCGKDGTTTFAQHHGTQISLLENYFVANLQ